MKRTRWISLGLVLAVLLLPLPASAGGFWESVVQGRDGAWLGLLDWLGLVETSSSYIDPNGQPPATAPGPSGTESCAMIDPNGCPGEASALIDSPGGEM